MSEITVIITAHNLEKFIDGCLAELEAQSFQDFDILIVDDCSQDSTLSRIHAFQQKGTLDIQIISPESNLGLPSRARNFALDSGLVTGKYMVFLDGDDSIEPTYLEKLHALAESTGAQAAACAYDRFEAETGHILCHEMIHYPELVELPPDTDVLAFMNGSLWNKLFLRSAAEGCRLPDFQAGEDLSFQLEVYQHCTRVACTHEELIHYRVHEASVISNLKEDTIYCFAQRLKQLWDMAPDRKMKNSMELTAFIHIGLSMTMRAYDNPESDMKKILGWVSQYFSENYGFFKGNPYFKLSSLAKHGIKGLGLKAALICYRIHCFPLFLWAFKTMTKTFHIDIKF